MQFKIAITNRALCVCLIFNTLDKMSSDI